jgi:hypothetical protein
MISKPNEDDVGNLLEQKLKIDEPISVLLSPFILSSRRKALELCLFLLDLYNREIVGYSAGKHKNIAIVQRNFTTV